MVVEATSRVASTLEELLMESPDGFKFDATVKGQATEPQCVPVPPPRVDVGCQCSASSQDQLEARLRAIETQLAATHEVMQTLTTLVHALQPPSGPPPGLVKPGVVVDDFVNTVANAVAKPADPALVPPSSFSKADERSIARTASIKQRRRTNETSESMARTVSTKDTSTAPDARPPLSLVSAAKMVRQIVRAASHQRMRVSDAPMMTRQVSVVALSQGSEKADKSFSRRVSDWSQGMLNKTARVMPSKPVTMRWLEDCPPHPLTIRYDSSGRIAWDVLIVVLILVDLVMTPLALSFGCFPDFLRAFNTGQTIAFTVDFVVHALSSYTTRRGIVVTGPANTIPNYLLSVWALADFLSWFPLEYVVPQGRFLGIAKVVRLVKISQIVRRFHSAKKAGILRLLRLISIVLLVSHILACYWNWVAEEWRRSEDGYLEKPILERYIHCWSIVIGSLNASPPIMHTPSEELSVAVFMLIGNLLQATVFGSVAALIQSFDEDEVAYNKKLIDTYERCKLLDIPEPLAKRINSYYEHLYRETRSVDPDADAFIHELSPALICEVKFQLYRDMVRQIPFFSSANINPVLIETLILKLRTVIYMQDDMLIRKGEFGDWMGFIGSKGSVGVLDPSSEVPRIVRVLRRGEYFGEMGLLHRTKRTTTAVALSWVQIHVLTRGDLDEVKEKYVEDAESLEHEIHKYLKSRVFSIREGKK